MYKEKRDALTRLTDLESMLGKLIGAIGAQLTERDRKLSAMEELLDAVIGAVGADAVSKALEESRLLRATTKRDTEKAEIEAAVKNGVLAPAETVTPDSIICISETRDGTTVPPGWFSFAMPTAKPEFRDRVLGKSAGYSDSVEEGGNQFTILEIYVPTAKAATEVA